MPARSTLSVRGPSSPIVKLASARSRRSALLRPRCARLTALIVPLSSAVWCPRARERTGRSKAVNTSRATSRESEGASLLVFSCPWSARPEPALWLKRHGKRPGGSLFPLGSVLGWPSRSCRRGCVERLRGRAYRWRRRHLRTVARPLSQLVGRRPLPPAILVIGQQTGRERPRPWFAGSFRGDRGVAHVLSAGLSVIDPAACKVLVVMTAKHTRRRHVTRRVDDRRETPQTLGLAGLSGSVMSLIKPGTRRKRGPSQSIVRLASSPSRRSALLRPRWRAANGLDRAVRQPHAAIIDGHTTIVLIDTRGDSRTS